MGEKLNIKHIDYELRIFDGSYNRWIDIEQFAAESLAASYDCIILNKYKDNLGKVLIYSTLEENIKLKLKEIAWDLEGSPDLICIKGQEISFIEVKSPSDKINISQLMWALRHPENKFTFLIYRENDKYISKYIIKS